MRRDVLTARQDEARLVKALEDQTAESSTLSRKTAAYESLKRDVANDRSLLESSSSAPASCAFRTTTS